MHTAADKARLAQVQAATAGLKQVERLERQGKYSRAQDLLFTHWKRASEVLGGGPQVRQALDRFSEQFAPIYRRIAL